MIVGLLQPRTLTIYGPQPQAGRQYCMVCIGLYKKAVFDLPGVMDRIKAAEEGRTDEDSFTLTELGPDVPLPELAVGMGISQMLGNQVVQACWTHAMPIQVTNILPAQGPLANGGLVR